MSVDRLLTTVLGLYQDVHDEAKVEQLFGMTTTLLTQLSNPLNLSLLTAQLLNAPAIWRHQDPIRTCYRIISIFNTAAIHVRRKEVDSSHSQGLWAPRSLRSDAWARAVVQGADDRSERWRHALVITGVLMGMEGDGRQSLTRGLRDTLEQAVVTASNLSLEDYHRGLPSNPGAILLALNYAFPLLSDALKVSINHDALLPPTARALFGEDGLHGGSFLDPISADVVLSGQRFSWPETSLSFTLLRQVESQPLVSSMGPLSRLLAYSIEHARDASVVLHLQEELVAFTASLLQRWKANKLCELEVSEEAAFLTQDTAQITWPVLWQLLKKTMYVVVAALNQVVARALVDPQLRSDGVAPSVATKALHILRNLYFVSSQQGNDAFQVYTFTYLASVDLLTRYPDSCRRLLQEITPPSSQGIPTHPLHRTLDLFYLNLAEQLPLSLSCDACDVLITQPATTYLTNAAPLSKRMTELFEAAHSAILSVMSCPDNASLTIRLAPFYADILFSSFPLRVSPRQFRLAFKTMMQIISPPFPISATHPELAELLLETVRFRVATADPSPLSPARGAQAQAQAQPDDASTPTSEQSTLVLTLIDSLPFLHLSIFEEWMALAAEALNGISDPATREGARRRFWEILVSGEMDVERAAIGVAWWGTKGGRGLVLYGAPEGPGPAQEFLMSGALQEEAMGSKLRL